MCFPNRRALIMSFGKKMINKSLNGTRVFGIDIVMQTSYWRKKNCGKSYVIAKYRFRRSGARSLEIVANRTFLKKLKELSQRRHKIKWIRWPPHFYRNLLSAWLSFCWIILFIWLDTNVKFMHTVLNVAIDSTLPGEQDFVRQKQYFNLSGFFISLIKC